MSHFFNAIRRCTLLSVLLCAVAGQAGAMTITATESRYEPDGIRYYFSIENWTYYDPEPSPCISSDPRLNICNLEIGVRLNPGTTSYAGEIIKWRVSTGQPGSTMGNLLASMTAQGFNIPFKASILVPTNSAPSYYLCLGFTKSIIGSNIGGAINLFGPCTPVRKPMLQCDISGDTTIDHKTLLDTAENGARASTQLGLKCRGATSVVVTASRTNSNGVQLRSDGTLYSKLTINGRQPWGGINVSVRENVTTPLDIVSTLSARAVVPPGDFSGSTVITISPP